jgi:hypothetical protein
MSSGFEKPKMDLPPVVSFPSAIDIRVLLSEVCNKISSGRDGIITAFTTGKKKKSKATRMMPQISQSTIRVEQQQRSLHRIVGHCYRVKQSSACELFLAGFDEDF